MTDSLARLVEATGYDPAVSTAIATLLGTLSTSILILVGFYFGPTARMNRTTAKETERLIAERDGLHAQIEINQLKAVVQEQEKDMLPEDQTVPPTVHPTQKEPTA